MADNVGLFGEKEEKKGFFSSTKKETAPEINPEVNIQLNEVGRKVKIIDQRTIDLSRKMESVENSFISDHNKVLTEIKAINKEMAELRASIDLVKTRIEEMADGFRDVARQEDINYINKYLELINPVNMITKTQIKRIIKEVEEEKNS